MVAKRRRGCLQEYRWVAPRASAGPGGPGGADAGHAFVSVSTSVQCPVQASNLHACLSTRLVSRVRCGRLSVRVSGVRAFPRPLCPTRVRSWRAALGQAAAWLGWPGSACSPAVSTTGSSEPGDRGCAGRAGPGTAPAWTRPSLWEVVGRWLGRPRGRPDRPHAREDRPSGRLRVARLEAATTLRGHRERPRAESPGIGEPLRLDFASSLRPQGGRGM
jgi:hypothetical protein